MRQPAQITEARTALSTVCAQRGSVLITLLLVMCLSTLVLSSLFVGSMEWSLASNALHDAQAFAFAESGVEHAMLALREEPGTLQALLVGEDASAGTLDDGRVLGPAPIVIGDGSYDVQITDNEDGDSDAYMDTDGLIYIRSTGVYRDTWVVVRAQLHIGRGANWAPPFGILTNDALSILESAQLVGPASAAHTNRGAIAANELLDGGLTAVGSLNLTADEPVVEGSSLDEAEVLAYEASHSSLPAVDVPDIAPADFQHLAARRLSSDGRVFAADGSVEFDTDGGTSDWGRWSYDEGNWTLASGIPGVDDGSFYVEGSVMVDGSAGGAGMPLALSVFAEGSVYLHGDLSVNAAVPGVVAVARGDVAVSSSGSYLGSLVAREQMEIEGSAYIAGHLIVADADDEFELLNRTDFGTLIGPNVVIMPPGSAPLGFNTGTASARIIEWREEH